LKRIYFGGAVTATKPNAPARLSEAAEAWTVVMKDVTNISALDAFIRRFGDTFYGDLAKARLADLKQQAEAAQQTAKKKSKEEARAKAESEHHRLAMLQQEDERRRAAEAAQQAAKRKSEEEARTNQQVIDLKRDSERQQ
jgi:hypothetical protein